MGTSRGLQAVPDEKTPFNTKHQRRRKRKTETDDGRLRFFMPLEIVLGDIPPL